MNYDYEADEQPKNKHRWREPQDSAGFKVVSGVKIGKCPSNLDVQQAREILNEGVPYSHERWGKSHPCAIFGVYEGVLYRAKPTNPGRSYHAFPADPDNFKWGSDLKSKILDLATRKGCREGVERWMGW